MRWIAPLLIILSLLMSGQPSCAHAHLSEMSKDTHAHTSVQMDDHSEPCHDMESMTDHHAEHSQEDMPKPCGDDCDGGITCKSCDLAPVAIVSLNKSKQIVPTAISPDHKPVHAFVLGAAYEPPPPKHLFKT